MNGSHQLSDIVRACAVPSTHAALLECPEIAALTSPVAHLIAEYAVDWHWVAVDHTGMLTVYRADSKRPVGSVGRTVKTLERGFFGSSTLPAARMPVVQVSHGQVAVSAPYSNLVRVCDTATLKMESVDAIRDVISLERLVFEGESFLLCACGDGSVSITHSSNSGRQAIINSDVTSPGERTISCCLLQGHILVLVAPETVSYTHLTLPTNREV